MKKLISMLSAAALTLSAVPMIAPMTSVADNPLAQNVYTADPAPMVHDGTLYLYTSHDNDNSDYFHINSHRKSGEYTTHLQ